MDSHAVGGWSASRPTWAAMLAVIYVTVGVLTWNRALIPDEIRPLIVAQGTLRELLEFARLDIVQTPLSYVAARTWLNTFGHSDSAARALALVLGTATIVLFTYIAGRFTAHWRSASLILCVIYLRVGSAPNLIRMYGLVVLLSIVALDLWDRWRLDPTPGRLVAWTATMVALFYTHASALLMLPGFVLATWLYGPRPWSRRIAFALAAGVSILALAPWVIYVYPVFAERGITANVQAIPLNPTRVLGRLPFLFLSGFDPGGGSPPLPMHSVEVMRPMKWVAILLHATLLAAAWPLLGTRSHLRRWREGDLASAGIMLSLCAGPVLLLYTFSVVFFHALHPRYLIVLFPAYCLLLTLLGYAGGRFGRFVLIGLILPWLLVSSGLTLVQHFERVPLQAGTDRVAREYVETDIVLCNNYMFSGYRVLWDWTRRLHRSEAVHVLSEGGPPWIVARFPGIDLEDLDLEGINRVWFFHRGAPGIDSVSTHLVAAGYQTRRQVINDWYHLTLFERQTPG